jgi:phosphoglucosamine mutase
MKRLFGTDGIRGVAGAFPLDQVTVGYIGIALGEEIINSGSQPKVIVGRDTRESGHWIAGGLIHSLCHVGVERVDDVGVITTPGLAFLTRRHQFELGIMISASHNPFEDNGIKIFSKDGFKLSDDREARLEKRIYQLIENRHSLPVSEGVRGLSNGEGIIEDYQSFLLSHFKGELEGYRMGLDVCNGSASSLAPRIFEMLGAGIAVINDTPNGRNINHDCGSLHLQGLIDLVTKLGLDFGVAFDGDADRSIFVDSSGRIFDGDYILHAFSGYFKQQGILRSGKVVGTVMTNFALEKALAEEGLELIRAAVGDKYVLEAMERTGANLGGEPSGHIILRDYHTTGDGILTALQLCEMICDQKVTLKALAEQYRPFPQVLDGLRVRHKIPISEVAPAVRAIENAERELGNSGRVVVRYSGTEPILRIMAEGENPGLVRALVRRLRSELESAFSSDGRRN